MGYEESNTIELKRALGDERKSEILAFLNSYLGVIIYVGVEKDGTIYKTSVIERDDKDNANL